MKTIIYIFCSVLVISFLSYVGIKQYKNYQVDSRDEIVKKNVQGSDIPELSEIEKLQKEVEELKRQQSSQAQPSMSRQGLVNTSSVKRAILSNTDIIKKIKPATVFIETTKGSGSGMIIDSSGYILTNAHVVWDVSAAKIKLSDGRSLSAEVIGRDEIVDLAILIM